MRNINGLLSWAERRIMYRIEADQELTEHRGYNTKLTDLASVVDLQPKAVRDIIDGLITKEYLQFEPREGPRGRRVYFKLIKPLGGQFQLQWIDGSSKLVRAF
jgi:DNA-binding MarR family transcriptional regulator